MKKKVLATRRIPGDALDYLAGQTDLILPGHDSGLSRDELLDLSKGCDGVLAHLSDRIDRQFLELRPEVRVVANYAVGFDNVDLEAAKEHGVVITNTPDVLNAATADMTMGLMLDVMRRISEGDRLMRRGGFKGISPFFMLGADLTRKTLGIYGMGRIGLEVAKRASAFDMKIIYHNRRQHPQAAGLGYDYVSFEQLLELSDVISINSPLSEETRGRFGHNEFRAMKKTAFIINTGRGPIIKEAELAEALKTGVIAGAGLDVYEFEPKANDGLLGLDNVVLCPHLGSAGLDTRTAMADLAVENLLAALRGDEPPNRVV